MDKNVIKCFFLRSMGVTILRTKTGSKSGAQPPKAKRKCFLWLPSPPVLSPVTYRTIPEGSPKARAPQEHKPGQRRRCDKVPGKWNVVIVTVSLILHEEPTALTNAPAVKPIRLYLSNGFSQRSPRGWEQLKDRDYVLTGLQQLA